MEKLFERLGTENNLFNTFVSREDMELYSAIQELIRNITDKNVSRIEKQIKTVEKLIRETSVLEHQSLYFAQGELARQRDKENEKAMQLYMKAIHVTLPNFDGKNPLRNNLLTFDEIMIINAIAILYSEMEDNIVAIRLNMWLKEYMENKIVDGKMKTAKYPVILYNLSCWFFDEQYYEETIQMADVGIDFCVKYSNLVIFPSLILNKGVAMAELGKMNEAKKYLHQAITIFNAMNRSNTVKTISDWCKTHYEIEV